MFVVLQNIKFGYYFGWEIQKFKNCQQNEEKIRVNPSKEKPKFQIRCHLF